MLWKKSCQNAKKSRDQKIKESSQIIIDLKNQLQEAKNIEEDLDLQLKRRIQESERLGEEIMELRRKLDDKYVQLKFENGSRTLDDMLSRQRPSSDKSGLGYDKEK